MFGTSVISRWYDKTHTPSKVTVTESSCQLGPADHFGGASLLYWWTVQHHAEARQRRVSSIVISNVTFGKHSASGLTCGGDITPEDVYLHPSRIVYLERTPYGQFIDIDSRRAVHTAKYVIFSPEGIRAVKPKYKTTQTEISLS